MSANCFRQVCLGLLFSLLLVNASPATDAPRARRNIVLIVADDLGLQLGCYGDPLIKTPGIDRLAAAGTRFTRAYCTVASCSASRSVILSGLYNHANGQYGLAHSDGHFSTFESVRTLPVMLAEAGYRTCSIGKFHVTPEYVYHFETYRNEGIQGSRNAVRMVQNARDWITEKDDRPFFLYFCSTDPHRGGSADGFSNFNDDPERYPGVTPVRYAPAMIPVPEWLPDQPEVRAELAEYYQSISRLDQGVGRLLDVLHETGHWENTLILFCSDNGPPFPGAKTTLYEPGTRLPLIVRDPDVKPGVTNARVTWADIVPTILESCDVQPPPGPPLRKTENIGQRATQGKPVPYASHGRSFLKAMREDHPSGWDDIYLSHTFHEIQMYYPMRSVLSGRYKYIINFASDLPYPFASDLYNSPTWQTSLKRQDERYGLRTVKDYVHRPRHELYDLESDPHELKNLAGESAFQGMLEEMQLKIRSWQQQTTDPWLSKWSYE